MVNPEMPNSYAFPSRVGGAGVGGTGVGGGGAGVGDGGGGVGGGGDGGGVTPGCNERERRKLEYISTDKTLTGKVKLHETDNQAQAYECSYLDAPGFACTGIHL